MEIAVRKVVQRDLPDLVHVMGRAFEQDPVANWMARQDAQRLRRIERLMAIGCHQMAFPHGEMLTTDGRQGAALWVPPGKWKLGRARQVRLFPQFLRIAGGRRIRAVLSGVQMVDGLHPHEPHFYLLALGVDPDHQGKGIGSQLMRPVLERCDAEGIPAYLESTNERNNPLYERNGFEVQKEIRLPNDGPPMWLMWREPRGGATHS